MPCRSTSAQGFRPTDQSELAGAVFRAAGNGPAPQNGSDVDDHGMPSLSQMRQSQPRQLGGAEEIDLEDATQTVHVRGLEETRGPDPGVVDEDVETAEDAESLFDEDGALGRVSHVGGDHIRVTALGMDGLGQGIETFPITTGQDEPSTLAGQLESQGVANAAGGTSEDGTCAVQVEACEHCDSCPSTSNRRRIGRSCPRARARWLRACLTRALSSPKVLWYSGIRKSGS